jgi:hypothetical protein
MPDKENEMNKRYSDAESRLFNYFGFGYAMAHLEPPPLYRATLEHVFIEGKTGPAVEALRRGARVLLFTGHPFRMTEAFDDLVSFVNPIHPSIPNA